MRERVTTALEVGGFGCITAGVAMFSPAAGLIAGGVFAVVIGVLEGQK